MSYISSNGYVMLYKPGHPLADKRGRIREHRLVWYNAHGLIPTGYAVHHKNRIKTDNQLSNLECILESDHKSLHAKEGGRLPVVPWNKGAPVLSMRCDWCGENFGRRASWQRAEYRKRYKHAYCSVSCSTSHRNTYFRSKAVGADTEGEGR